ncbi:MAG: NAD(P)/FAD-dependent oxidoreductase [Candidatus Latescibacterota bacterium]|jgi:pyruvate/2-oxoglutarate dehydrogenase complex dihydrolipoamide dehydrogenase (E3) component
MKHQIVVIGGGSAGYAAARTARDAGAEVAIVDCGPLGGLCILRGCMPTKTILASAAVMARMRRGPEFGLLPVEPRADLAAIISRKDRLVREFAEYRIEQLRDPRFTLYEEPAAFLSPNSLQVGSRVVEADRFVIATGSVPHLLAVPGLSETGYLTSDEALELRRQPASMLVLGGGPVALELAQFFQRLGTRVTLVQRSPHVLSHEDEDLAVPLEEALRAEGMEVLTGTRLLGFSREEGLAVVRLIHRDREVVLRAETVLQAAGRRPDLDGLNLVASGVAVEEGRVLVDAEMRTSQPHIFAVGDVNGLHEIVHIAILQGEVAGHNAALPDRPPKAVDDRLNARVTFTDPQVASVGLSERACRERGEPYLAASYPFADHGKAICLGETHGQVKLLCRPGTGELIGGHIVGPEAGELLHELIAVMHFHGTVHDLLAMPHYHPTLAEILTYPAEELAGHL